MKKGNVALNIQKNTNLNEVHFSLQNETEEQDDDQETDHYVLLPTEVETDSDIIFWEIG